MNALIQEWIKKAEGDFVSATGLLGLELDNVSDSICFHCQQCVEKYMKAYLQSQAIEFSRTHDLIELLSLCKQGDDSFSTLLPHLQALNSYSVETRYPGRFTSLEEAQGAVETMKTARDFIRPKMGL